MEHEIGVCATEKPLETSNMNRLIKLTLHSLSDMFCLGLPVPVTSPIPLYCMPNCIGCSIPVHLN